MKFSKAYNEGKSDFHRDDVIGNPYAYDRKEFGETHNYDEWERGYADAYAEWEDELESEREPDTVPYLVWKLEQHLR